MDASTAATFLKAAGGRPTDALEWHARGHTGKEWSDFPHAMAQGQVAWVKDWSVQELIDALQAGTGDA
jgi:DNA polymerase-3 subunit delta'